MNRLFYRLLNGINGLCIAGITGVIHVFIFKDQYFMFPLLLITGYIIGFCSFCETKQENQTHTG